MFGDRLKELREDKKMTQENLANYLGVSRQTISGYELETSEPSITNLIKISDMFNVSLDYLLGRTKEKHNINLLDKYSKELLLEVIKVVEKYNINKK
ncbi:helix-turn-helix domain-containing protein [Clostridium sp. YIM B02551]|uniref:helix-turn-helix domain-containing protein n=1 Tax=Clostridium sp. YIM B02551 TaxID=2910679 RepID=UPI001EECE70E|nr:helix-turn-helix transcriptional regulator [Clostridium sp. YIM B02551]